MLWAPHQQTSGQSPPSQQMLHPTTASREKALSSAPQPQQHQRAPPQPTQSPMLAPQRPMQQPLTTQQLPATVGAAAIHSTTDAMPTSTHIAANAKASAAKAAAAASEAATAAAAALQQRLAAAKARAAATQSGMAAPASSSAAAVIPSVPITGAFAASARVPPHSASTAAPERRHVSVRTAVNPKASNAPVLGAPVTLREHSASATVIQDGEVFYSPSVPPAAISLPRLAPDAPLAPPPPPRPRVPSSPVVAAASSAADVKPSSCSSSDATGGLLSVSNGGCDDGPPNRAKPRSSFLPRSAPSLPFRSILSSALGPSKPLLDTGLYPTFKELKSTGALEDVLKCFAPPRQSTSSGLEKPVFRRRAVDTAIKVSLQPS